MTRDELFIAVSDAFDGVKVWAAVGFWNVTIESKPRREIIFSNWFVSQNIDKEGISPEELTEILRAIRNDDWFIGKDGCMLLQYGFPSGISGN